MEEGWHRQRMRATVLNLSPSLGSQRRRHASATSSPPVNHSHEGWGFLQRPSSAVVFTQNVYESFSQVCFGLYGNNPTGMWL